VTLKATEISLQNDGEALINQIKIKTSNAIPNLTTLLTEKNINDFFDINSEKTVLILFTDKPSINPIIKTVANTYKKIISIGVVDNKQKSILQR